MKIVLIGQGGREHAFAWKMSQSPLCSQLFIAPGNAGTAACGTNVPISVSDFEALASFCREQKPGLVVVGPEEPLVKGLRDFFAADAELKDIPFVGPGAEGAQLEGSKDFSKSFMQRHGIPTALARTFTVDNYQDGENYIRQHSLPVVLKADGLAAGKGVVICETHKHALAEFEAFIHQAKFGDASKKVLVEEFLQGIELSVFVLTDGRDYHILPSAKDYKRVGVGDTGLNTGGMGAVSPVPFADAAFMQKVEEQIVKPTINGLQQDGIAYNGFVFIGLMNCGGNPKVIEYNCRMGDPETEVVLPRISSDLTQLLLACGKGELATAHFETETRAATTVMLVSAGYPGDYEKGKVITGMDDCQGSLLFHSGTARNASGDIVTNGGRVMAVTSLGQNLFDALKTSLNNAATIQYEGKYYRTDIGFEFIQREL